MNVYFNKLHILTVYNINKERLYMQLKLNKRLNLIILCFIILIGIIISYLLLNPSIWATQKFIVIVIFVCLSTFFLIWFKYYEKTIDQNLINNMVANGNISLVRLESSSFNRVIKDSNNIKYMIWNLNLTVFDMDGNQAKLNMCDKFDMDQKQITPGYFYITNDKNNPGRNFVIPNLLLGAFEPSRNIVACYEKQIKHIKYLNVYFKKGIIIETFQNSLQKEKQNINHNLA